MAFKKEHLYHDRYLNDDEDDDDSEIIRNLKEELEIQDDNGDENDDQNNGTIIMDADGNYYFQTSDKMVKVQPLAKTTQSPVKKVSATVVSSSIRRKATGKPERIEVFESTITLLTLCSSTLCT